MFGQGYAADTELETLRMGNESRTRCHQTTGAVQRPQSNHPTVWVSGGHATTVNHSTTETSVVWNWEKWSV